MSTLMTAVIGSGLAGGGVAAFAAARIAKVRRGDEDGFRQWPDRLAGVLGEDYYTRSLSDEQRAAIAGHVARDAARVRVARLAARPRLILRLLAASPAEAACRRRLGMPRFHPERVARRMSRREHDELGRIARGLWPEAEYTDVIEDHHRSSG